MKLLWMVAIVVAGMSVSGLAQQNNQFKIKHIPADKEAKRTTVVTGKQGSMPTAASANSKDLRSIERETTRSSGAVRTPRQRTVAFKPMVDKPNPPMNFTGAGSGKNAGFAKQSANPYKGRLKQKSR
ncbi:MAG: hypothetical protein WBW53_04675 [Terriglobales bacterium]